MGWLDRVLGPGDRDAFADVVARALAGELGGPAPAYDPAAFQLSFGTSDLVELGNAWQEAEPLGRRARARFAAQWARAMAAARRHPVPERFDDAIDLLLPRVRARVWYELLDLRARAAGRVPMRVPFRVLGEHYAVEVVCDFPETVTSVTEEHVARWGRSFDDLLTFAVGNLRRRPPGAVGSLGDTSFRTVMSGDTYDASRILVLDDALRGAALRGTPVAAIPHRDALFVAAEEDPAGLEILARITADHAGRPYANAAVVLRRDDASWTPWLPPAGHPSHAAIRDLAARSDARDHREQQQAMQAALTREGTAVFVATLHDLVLDGAPSSWSAWTRGVATALPRSGAVVFNPEGPEGPQPGRAACAVRWDDAVRICGARMQPMNCWPPRWRVDAFPGDEEWAALTAVAIRDGERG